jgi:hypothetical protein
VVELETTTARHRGWPKRRRTGATAVTAAAAAMLCVRALCRSDRERDAECSDEPAHYGATLSTVPCTAIDVPRAVRTKTSTPFGGNCVDDRGSVRATALGLK